LALKHHKLVQVKVDFDHLNDVDLEEAVRQQNMGGDKQPLLKALKESSTSYVAFCALGTTIKKAGSKENFYRIDHEFCFVDLPGYGFAHVPDEIKEEWSTMIEEYLFHRRNLKGIILIVDARHKPTDDDLMMYEWLLQMQIPHLIVGTKVDKLSNSQRKPNRNQIFEKLRLEAETLFTYFSAKTGEGKKEVLKFVNNNLNK